jgi:FMN phosphatase YigB (HAD superfamily)
MAAVSSFDIFGTLLSRREVEPVLRFKAAYRPLGFGGGELEDLARLRVAAERKASHRWGSDLYSLDDIYREMDAGPCTAPLWEKSAMAAELQMEKEECFANHYGAEKWERARKTSAIIYATDMYLPAAFIQELLERNGLWTKGARLFVSHVEGRAKHSGLFEKILRELKVSPAAILHVGDSWNADVRAPRRLGIRTEYFQGATPTRYERRLAVPRAKPVAKAFRFSRLGVFEQRRGASDVAWETACDVIAPLFLPYVRWVASQAVQKKLKRLYFVSRDGLIFKRIYDILKKDQPAWPESRYLYGSRQAWCCVRAAEFHEKDLDFLLYEKTNVTPHQVFRRIGFSNDEASRLEVPEWLAGCRHQVAGRQDLEKIKELLKEPFWVRLIRAHGRERLEAAQGYLRQEGLYGDETYGLVDLGWGGNLQSYLDRILRPSVVPAGFYFHLTQKSELTELGRALGWLPQLPFYGWDASAARAALEIFCSAEHGMTVGYRRAGTAWEPILGPLDAGGPEQQLAPSHHAAVQVCVRNWMQESGFWPGQESDDGSPKAAMKNFKNFMLSPSLSEAETYGATRLTSRQEGGDSEAYGPEFTLAMACGSFQKKFAQRETHWPGAIIRRSRGLAQIMVFLRFGLARTKSALRKLLGLE